MSSFENITLDDVKERWDSMELEKLVYEEGERGWVKRWDDDHVVIANVPFFAGLNLFDIVTVATAPDGRSIAGEVVWRGYTKKVSVCYPAGSDEEALRFYKAIGNAVRERGMRIEGAYAGMCMVNCQAGDDIAAVLGEAGIEMDGIKIGPGDDDDDEENG